MSSIETWDDVEEELGVRDRFEKSRDSFESTEAGEWSPERQYQGFLYNEGLNSSELDENYFGTIDELLLATSSLESDLDQARAEVADAYRDIRQALRGHQFDQPEDYIPGIAVRNGLQDLIEESFDWLGEAREFYNFSGKPQVTAAAAVYASAESRYGDSSDKFTQKGIAEAAGEEGVTQSSVRRRQRDVARARDKKL